ncbi:hypothetical protein Bcon01_67120 [Burkholderia contaminans]|nr:hypothetical protein Bcon01_67120 [Burkholderia contaminans]
MRRSPCLPAPHVSRPARRTENIMNFGLLVSQNPHIDDSRACYDTMLSLQPRTPNRFAAFWRCVSRLIS